MEYVDDATQSGLYFQSRLLLAKSLDMPPFTLGNYCHYLLISEKL